IYREVIKLNQATIAPQEESRPNGTLLSELPKDPSESNKQPKPLVFGTKCDKCPPYAATSDLKDIHWAPDAPDAPGGSGTGRPYFEKGHSAEFDCDSLTLFDRPEIRPDVIDKFFFAPNIVVRTVARDYAICGGQVVRQVTWISDETVDQNKTPHWKYQ